MGPRYAILTGGLDLKTAEGLEIGALCSPIVSKSDGAVTYVDWASTEVLVEKYRDDPQVDVDRIVPVDAIWGGQALLDCLGGRQVDYVIAAQIGEHVPDLISWLQEVRSVLKPGGELRLGLPDKRFTFDVRRAETDVSDLLTAYLVKARRPQLREIIDFKVHVSLEADGNSLFSGAQQPAELAPLHTFGEVLEAARASIDDPEGYLDVHCWVFTPATFARLMEQIAGFGLLDMACTGFVDSNLDNGLEFYVFLRPSEDRDEVVASWRRMAEAAQDPLPGSAAAVAAAERERRAAHAEEELEAIRHALAQARLRIAGLEASTSWRMTAPLRTLSRAIAAIRRPGSQAVGRHRQARGDSSLAGAGNG